MKTRYVIINGSLLLAALFIQLLSMAQQRQLDASQMPKDGLITGTIYDKQSNKAVEYASIAVYSQRDSLLLGGTVSQSNGHFRISDLPYGKHYLLVSFIGYENSIISDIAISPKQKEVNAGRIMLSQTAFSMQEVEVSTERRHIEYQIDKRVINVSRDIVGASGTAVDILENTPSVSVDIDGNVSLRGTSNFTVLIDGKPSVISANDLLKQIPASSIDQIEIITNPSAKYDPDGIGGIINVITKKQRLDGFNGITNLTLGMYKNYALGVLLNYRINKVNVFVDFNTNRRGTPGKWSMNRTSTLKDTNYYILANSERLRFHTGLSVNSGIEYSINNRNYLSFSFERSLRSYGNTADSRYHEYANPLVYDLYFLRETASKRDYNSYSGNLYYQHKFKKPKHELSSSIIYSVNDGGEVEELEEFMTDSDFELLSIAAYRQRSKSENQHSDLRIKADYELPLNEKSKFEAGVQARINNGLAVYDFEKLDTLLMDWKLDSEKHNDLEYRRNIYAAYSTYTGSLMSIDYKLGFRFEYTDRLIKQNVLNIEYPVIRPDYFPSIHLSKKLNEKNQIMASYSKRVNHPREWFLDPFPNYFDPNNIRVGNPALEPEFIHSYEINYQRRMNKVFFSVETYYRQTNNKISRISTLNDNNVMIHTWDNLNRDYSIGTEVSGNFDIKPWWQMNLSFNFFNYNIRGEILDEDINQVTNTYSLRFNTSLRMKWGSRIQLTSSYMAPSLTAQGKTKPYFHSNLGIRHDFFKNKLTASLSVRNFLGTSKWGFTSTGHNFTIDQEFQQYWPVVQLSLNYNINNYKRRQERNGDRQMDMDQGDMF